MIKKIVSLLTAAVMALSATMLTSCGGSGGSKNTIRIGVFEPASGDNGAGGKQEILGVQYANAVQSTVEINEKEYKVELVVADNESSNERAPLAAQELIDNGVKLVLGSYGSGVSIAASETFAAGGVPVVGISCTNPQVTEGNEHYFRICFLDSLQGEVLAKFATESFKAKKAYVLAKLSDDYSSGLANRFTEVFRALGGEVICETFGAGTTDFASYIERAKNAGVDVFFAPISAESAVKVIEQAAASGLRVPLIAGDTWDSNVILNAAKGKDVSIYVTTYCKEDADAELTEGIKAWLSEDNSRIAYNGGNSKVAAVTVMGYDAYFVALEAIRLAGSTKPKDIQEALKSVNYNGVTGNIQFDEKGDAKRDRAYIKSLNTGIGSWDFVAEQTVSNN